MNANDEIDRLIAGFVDGTLSEADKEAFERTMREHPDAIQRAAGAVRFEMELAEAVAPDQIELVQERRVVIDRATGRAVKVESIHRVSQPTAVGAKTGPAKQKTAWWIIGALAVTLAAGGLWFGMPLRKPVTPPTPTAEWVKLPLKNPGFEFPDWGNAPTSSLAIQDWQEKFTTPNARLVVPPIGEAHGGKQMATLAPGGWIKQSLFDAKGNPITFEPGLKVRISGWVKPNVPITGRADIFHPALHYVDDQYRQYVVAYRLLSLDGSGWRRFSVELTVPDQETFEPSYYRGGPYSLASVRGRPVLLSFANMSYWAPPRIALSLDDIEVEILPVQGARKAQ